MKKVAVFISNGFEEIEALSPVDYLRRADVDVVTVAVPEKGAYKQNSERVVVSSHKIPVIADITLDEYLDRVKDTHIDCVVCPGGSVGAKNLASCKELLDHINNVWTSGKIVAAICASPAVVLGKTKVLAGKTWTCYPGMESNADKSFVKKYVNKVFVTDGNLITARGPGASEEFAMELVRILAGQETADKIHRGSQQR